VKYKKLKNISLLQNVLHALEFMEWIFPQASNYKIGWVFFAFILAIHVHVCERRF
jgi:hypothetical protein